MHTQNITATPAHTPLWRVACRWLRGLTRLWPRHDLKWLDDRTRRDIGLPRPYAPPDAATLLDMSRPGGRRW